MFWQNHPKTYPLLILIAGLYILKLFTLYVYRRRNKIKGKDNFIIGINTIYYVFLTILLLLLTMVVMKVNIKEFFTSISIIAAAIAIVSKDYISNAINGMILMFNNQFSINDKIKIGHQKGRIIHISLLNVQIINEEDDIIFIPNNSVLSQEIINYSKAESTKVSMELTVDAFGIESFDELEKYFASKLELDVNVEKGSFKLKILEVNYRKARIRAEVNMISKGIRLERHFKRQLLDAWFEKLRQKN
ncbi:MAG: mechanosensitive ion channel [Bacteroidia bacterium]|nr:mechanosensitive ion channel [Bacteroidia bacterium]